MEKSEYELLKSLNRNIKKLNKRIDKQLSFGWVFFRGMVNGLGYAIATTIIIGLILGFLSRYIDSVEDIPILKDMVEQEQVQNILDQN